VGLRRLRRRDSLARHLAVQIHVVRIEVRCRRGVQVNSRHAVRYFLRPNFLRPNFRRSSFLKDGFRSLGSCSHRVRSWMADRSRCSAEGQAPGARNCGRSRQKKTASAFHRMTFQLATPDFPTIRRIRLATRIAASPGVAMIRSFAERYLRNRGNCRAMRPGSPFESRSDHLAAIWLDLKFPPRRTYGIRSSSLRFLLVQLDLVQLDRKLVRCFRCRWWFAARLSDVLG